MGSNLRAGLTQPELFWSICLENSCCCVHTLPQLEPLYSPKSNCATRATLGRTLQVPVLPHTPATKLAHCLFCPAPSPAEFNIQEAISGNTVSNLHSWDFLLSKFSALCYPRTQKF